MPVDQGVEPAGAFVVLPPGVERPAGKVGVGGVRLGVALVALLSPLPSPISTPLRGIAGSVGATRCSSAAGGRGHSGGGGSDAGGTVEHAQSSSVQAGAALRSQGDLFMEFSSQGVGLPTGGRKFFGQGIPTGLRGLQPCGRSLGEDAPLLGVLALHSLQRGLQVRDLAALERAVDPPAAHSGQAQRQGYKHHLGAATKMVDQPSNRVHVRIAWLVTMRSIALITGSPTAIAV